MDWTAIPALTGAFKTLTEAVQGVSTLRSEHELKVVRDDLLDKLVTARQAAFDLQDLVYAARDRNEELERENTRLRGFEADRERYELTELGDGALAYALKEEASADAPMHYLCANCFDESRRSILQFDSHQHGYKNFKCHACNATVRAFVSSR